MPATTYYGTGRRKSSTARVYMTAGSGTDQARRLYEFAATRRTQLRRLTEKRDVMCNAPSAGPLAARSDVTEGVTASAFRRWLDHLATGAAASGPVTVPRHPTASFDGLKAALDDPSSVLPWAPEGQTARPGRAIDRLYQLAIWLRYAPSGAIPPALVSRAARLRFQVWTLPIRFGWPAELVDVRVSWRNDYVVGSKAVVVEEATAARDLWRTHLDSWENDAWLAGRAIADPGWREEELQWLVVDWPLGGGRSRISTL